MISYRGRPSQTPQGLSSWRTEGRLHLLRGDCGCHGAAQQGTYIIASTRISTPSYAEQRLATDIFNAHGGTEENKAEVVAGKLEEDEADVDIGSFGPVYDESSSIGPVYKAASHLWFLCLDLR